ncbi:MAG: cytochrome b/b6 domain-containing protein [Ectothiorhodospiraceae bacterium]|jgi:cytochrome b|nr:cytochrome b/b6 domain-containing protein [Ectothiorhodospiraceae bacterium]
MQEIKVWDPLVRVFHWSLVAAFAIAFVTEDDFQTLHTYAGYTVLGLVLTRLVWGFVGTRHARFSDFVRSPREVLAYLKDMLRFRPPHFVGHNPAGGAMIVLLLASLLLTTLTGLMTWGAEGEGPFGAWLWQFGSSGEKMLEETHEFFANFTLLLVVVHVAGVAVGSLMHRENLVRAMVTGRKQVDGGQVQ